MAWLSERKLAISQADETGVYRTKQLDLDTPAKLASIADAPTTPPKALAMVAILVDGHEAVARTARALFPLVDKAGDEPTADLLTQRLTVHEQTAWMLRSLLEE